MGKAAVSMKTGEIVVPPPLGAIEEMRRMLDALPPDVLRSIIPPPDVLRAWTEAAFLPGGPLEGAIREIRHIMGTPLAAGPSAVALASRPSVVAAAPPAVAAPQTKREKKSIRERRERVKKLYVEGLTAYAMADNLACGESTIWADLAAMGLKLRT